MGNENPLDFQDQLIKCPICHHKIISDANLKAFCALCGMNLEDGKDRPKFVDENGENEFCCEECLSKFKSIYS
ncbi:hypothetical protein [Candidatus Lokiarchaeum ossiferum]|uniref:hypothetical protein n=1 Tax=Candidatus Lokiarchaeum ossiferum TaxID=2951803 RepID=UPI00352EB56F